MKYLSALLPLCMLSACSPSNPNIRSDNRETAERYFRSVYSCDLSVIDELAADDIIVSYPIFKELINSQAISGGHALKKFHTRFCNKWKDPKVTIHETIAEDDAVVVIWSFRARDSLAEPQPDASNNAEQSWGGITVYRVNQEGKIACEFGEESAPGPFARLTKPTE